MLRLFVRATPRLRCSMARPIVFVTGNKGKLLEVAAMMGSIPMSNEALDLPELQGTCEEISIAKCKAAAEKVNGPVFVEDTALCFKALGDMPGPYVKWFLDSIGHKGLSKMVEPFEEKTGYAQTIFSFTSGPNSQVHTFVGRTHGNIVAPRGDPTFAALTWDPIFEPLAEEGGDGRTYAEMSKDEKNKISHRSKALNSFKKFLVENPSIWDGSQ